MVFGIRLSIGTVGEQADNLEATARAAAYQDCHGHCGLCIVYGRTLLSCSDPSGDLFICARDLFVAARTQKGPGHTGIRAQPGQVKQSGTEWSVRPYPPCTHWLGRTLLSRVVAVRGLVRLCQRVVRRCIGHYKLVRPTSNSWLRKAGPSGHQQQLRPRRVYRRPSKSFMGNLRSPV